jgi:hypothetical protein
MWALFTPLIIAATITAIVLTIKLRILQYRVLTLQLDALPILRNDDIHQGNGAQHLGHPQGA